MKYRTTKRIATSRPRRRICSNSIRSSSDIICQNPAAINPDLERAIPKCNGISAQRKRVRSLESRPDLVIKWTIQARRASEWFFAVRTTRLRSCASSLCF